MQKRKNRKEMNEKLRAEKKPRKNYGMAVPGREGEKL